MNILTFAHDSSMYGASQSLLTALAGIVKKDHRKVLVLLPYPGKMEDALRSAGIDYEIVSFPLCMASHEKSKSFIDRSRNIYNYYKQLTFISPQLEKIVYRFKADVIYTNTSVVVAGYKIARHLHIPHVWHVREVGENFVYVLGRPYIAKAIGKSERSIFVSNFVKKNWVTNDDSRFSVVYHGILDADVCSEKMSRKLPDRNPRIGIVGAVLPGKGQHLAIQAFAGLLKVRTNCELMIYGDPHNVGYFNSLRKLVQELQIEDKVYFKDFLEDKNEIYRNLDILLSCSLMDSFNRTVVEAMCNGVPVIANASGGIAEVIDANSDGLLFDGTPDSLALSLIRLLSDSKLYRDISVNGMRKAEKYSTRNYVDSIDFILHDAAVDAART